MSRNRATVKAAPEVVFDVLSDPRSYEYWVVGNKRVRQSDPAWPRPGTEFHHTVGIGPLATKDKTVAVEADEPRRLVMHARAMPVGVALVTLELEPDGTETRVTIEEHPVEGPMVKVWNPVLDRLTWLRNVESLRRLKRLAEQRAAAPGPAAGP